MTRRYAWAAAVAAAVLLGFVFGSLRQSKADPPAPATASEAQAAQAAALLDQVKEMQSQVKEINTFLRTGSIKVVVLLNPDAPK